MADFDSAVRLGPDFSPAFDNRGFAYAIQNQTDRAIEDYNQAVKLNRTR